MGLLATLYLASFFAATQGLSVSDFKGKNVVVFMTDQERHIMHFPPGWSDANLPGLTQLKNTGVSFEKAITNACMCSPARSTFFTGYLPAQHGVRYTLESDMPDSQYPQVQLPLPHELSNMATVFSAAGYNVVYKGKFHMTKAANPNGTWAPSDVGQYGFTRWNPKDAGANQDLDEGGGGTYPGGDNDYRFMASEGNVSAGDEGVLQFINSAAAQAQPFLLVISLVNPHDVLFYPKKFNSSGYANATLEGDIRLPATVDEDLSTKPSAQANFVKIFNLGGPLTTPDMKLEYLNFYANLMKESDAYLVQTLDALKANSLLDDTLIIRTADHGEMGLAHGTMRQKNFVQYEEAYRVPLVFSNPSLFPTAQTSDALVSHVDMLPTLATLIGAPEAARRTWAGVDYSKVVLNPTAPGVQDYVVFTFDDFQSGQANGPYVSQPNHLVAIREKRYKLAVYYDPSSDATKVKSQYEMYDLLADPLETDNLAQEGRVRSPAHQLQYLRLKAKLAYVVRTRLAPLPRSHGIQLTAATKTKAHTATVITDQGSAAGAPIGKGRASLTYTLKPKAGTATTTILITSDIGLIRGTATTTFATNGTHIAFAGTAAFTSGTGVFQGIRATGLAFSDTNTLDGQHGAVSISGTAIY